jgi:hypothetical protein
MFQNEKNTHTPYTYNSSVPGLNPSPGPVPKEKKRKGTLETFQNEKNNTHLILTTLVLVHPSLKKNLL